MLEDASRALDSATHRRYYPRIETRYYDFQEAYCLKIDRADLLSVTTLTTYSDGVTIASTDYFLKCGDSYNLQPYDRIALDRNRGGLFGYSGAPERSQKVIGVFGFHDDYAAAHVASGATVQGSGINAGTLTMTVSDGSLLQRGQTIRMESEWSYVSNISSNTVTLSERGLNGSTAATHAAGVAIEIYKPMRDVERVTLRFAVWLYKQLESPFHFELQTDATGRVVIPPNAPPEVHRFIKTYRRVL
jgi:hypothetical protein